MILSPQAADANRAEREITGMSEEFRSRRVLVVDDEALIRWSLTQTLEDLGFDVQQASTGADALACIRSADFDVVVLDFRLPDSNDLSLLMHMRALSPESAVILMTAFSTPEVAQDALTAGAVRVVNKPFEMSDMAGYVEQAL